MGIIEEGLKIAEEDYLTKYYLDLIGKILYSIRIDFDKKDCLRARKKLALKLTKMLIKENPNFFQLKILKKKIKQFKVGRTDGRWFRDDFPYGYQGMFDE